MHDIGRRQGFDTGRCGRDFGSWKGGSLIVDGMGDAIMGDSMLMGIRSATVVASLFKCECDS
jgi:hypothetical protein